MSSFRSNPLISLTLRGAAVEGLIGTLPARCKKNAARILLAGAPFRALSFFHPMIELPPRPPAKISATGPKGAGLQRVRNVPAQGTPDKCFMSAPPTAAPQTISSSSVGLWSSIALRFSGFSAHLEALVEPVGSLRTPRLARVYFSQKLPEVTALAARHPTAARRIIASSAPASAHLWRDLLLVATGDQGAMERACEALAEASRIDAAAIAQCCLAVARHRPREGRELLAHAFAHAAAAGQVAILGALALHEDAATPALLGEAFLSMMEGSTRADRVDVIYPALARLIASQEGKRSSRVGFLSALFRGWLSECPHGKVIKERLEEG
jgi:hypothetical protein